MLYILHPNMIELAQITVSAMGMPTEKFTHFCASEPIESLDALVINNIGLIAPSIRIVGIRQKANQHGIGFSRRKEIDAGRTEADGSA
jgi:hypothetical protein